MTAVPTRTGEKTRLDLFFLLYSFSRRVLSSSIFSRWAAAASLYNMLTGHFPRDFPKGKDPWQTVLQTSAVPIRKRNQHIPKRLAEVIDEALVDDPEIRFKSAAELEQALQGALR